MCESYICIMCKTHWIFLRDNCELHCRCKIYILDFNLVILQYVEVCWLPRRPTNACFPMQDMEIIITTIKWSVNGSSWPAMEIMSNLILILLRLKTKVIVGQLIMSLNFNSIFCIRKKNHENIKQIIYLFKESNHFPWDINTMYMYKNNLLVKNEMRVIINLNVCLQ